jgi:murein DD-endopeptidase MepM/ murein hydrolase activator NlpD
MSNLTRIFTYLLWLSSLSAFSQTETYPQNYFRPPLNLAPQASGSFGELRSNHFHSGTDYRTNQREGYPVYAVADGFVSRTRVQIGGGGNALYVDHPNGYTSVYMHLLKYNDEIASVVKNKQYSDQQFAVDFSPEKNLLPVKKGEIIAYAGNTGGSTGPHLHFELRDTRTEKTINPQLFGLLIPDNIPPIISGFTVYRLGNAPFSENTPRENIAITGANGVYKLSTAKPILVNGNTGFGIIAIDPNSASANRNGIYSIELLLDGEPIFESILSSFYFHHSRAINSYIDYPTYILKSQRIQKSFVEPGNPLTIYQNLVNNGLVNVKDDQVHEMLYRVKDVKGNTSSIRFSVRFDPTLAVEQNLKQGTILFPYNQENEFKTLDLKVSIPANSLYSDLNFTYSTLPKPANGYSPIHAIHNRMIPLHSGYSLSILADDLPEHLQSKALIVDSRGRSQGGKYSDGYVSAKMSELGNFHIGVDTTPPVIRPINISENKVMTNIKRIDFKISDNLSGIQSFNAYLNGQWILMEYDSKSASLWHVFENNLPKGKLHFKLVVKDAKDNEKIYEANFIR